MSADAAKAISQAYEDHQVYLNSAYKMGSDLSDEQLADDLERIAADLRGDKPPGSYPYTAVNAGSLRDAAYRQYEADLTNAWRAK